jgi:hypothetical protein
MLVFKTTMLLLVGIEWKIARRLALALQQPDPAACV